MQYLMAACWALAPVAGQNAAAQKKIYGTIDGQAIPDRVFAERRVSAIDLFRLSHHREPVTAADEQEIEAAIQKSLCGRLRGEIRQRAREEQMDKLGVVVTEQDIEKERRRTEMPDPKKMREHAAAAVDAFAALDRGEDPKQVYEQMVKPHGIDEMEWNIFLENRTTEAGRAHIRMEFSMTDEAWAKFAVRMTESLTYAAKSRKLDEAVDQQIASTDPSFRQYLYEERERGNGPNPRQREMPGQHKDYLDQTRVRWWKVRLSQVKVVLSDRSLGQTCALGELGVQGDFQH